MVNSNKQTIITNNMNNKIFIVIIERRRINKIMKINEKNGLNYKITIYVHMCV